VHRLTKIGKREKGNRPRYKTPRLQIGRKNGCGHLKFQLN
jgi:hypothetical protein